MVTTSNYYDNNKQQFADMPEAIISPFDKDNMPVVFAKNTDTSVSTSDYKNNTITPVNTATNEALPLNASQINRPSALVTLSGNVTVLPPFAPPQQNRPSSPVTLPGNVNILPPFAPPQQNRPISPIFGPGPVIPQRPNTGSGKIRFLYAAVSQPAVNISIDNNNVVFSMRYSNVTPYYIVSSGRRQITVTDSRNGMVLANMNLPVANGQIYTVALINSGNSIRLDAISDADCRRFPGMSCLRAINLVANSAPSNIFISGQGLAFRNVQFRNITDYIQLRPGNYTVYVTDRRTTVFPIASQIALAVVNGSFRPWVTANIGLERNTTYTLYLIGNANGFPPAQAMLVETDWN